MNDEYCHQCGRQVIAHGQDITCWLCLESRGKKEYTCAFCSIGAEPNSIEAIVILGPYGRLPLKVETYDEAIKKELGR